MPKLEKATFAGGCFWCMEYAYRNTQGIVKIFAGYSGGNKVNPTYEEVSMGVTGHYEAIQLTYDPSKVTYEELLDIYWKNIDPTDEEGQFADKGPQYMTAIFYHTQKQKKAAEKSKNDLEKSGKFSKPIATRILPYKNFYKAEAYHQQYYKKNAFHFKMYEEGSGRAPFLRKTWGSF